MLKKTRRSGEAREILEAIGAEGKQGTENAKTYFKEEEKKRANQKALELEILTEKRRRKEEYTLFLCGVLNKYVGNIPWTSGWSYRIGRTDRGIILRITHNGKHFGSAFAVTGDPTLDVNAVENFAMRAENLFDKSKQTPGGIILP